ncbi:uncharacterized protein LOC120349998 isoform X2 [Nilaparvata lugens]|uniref:uncharacterized protein LOC120349998 isoform X2 n=1 Tax=Nilaparvata lugens TaxID=108931 RepID=UPI00193E39C9|nr:uncharacterized protein LOC120349998 isoform X2 [Nilaparvata lugens]
MLRTRVVVLATLWLGFCLHTAVHPANSSCLETWHRTPEDSGMNIFINKSMADQYELLTWQWLTDYKDGLWTISLKKWPNLQFVTGSLKYKSKVTGTESHFGWRVKKKHLTWSGKQNLIFQPGWNMSVCGFSADWGFIPGYYGHWSFRLGNVTMTGELGSDWIDELRMVECVTDKDRRRKRSPQEADPPPDIPDEIPTNNDGTRSFLKWLLRRTGLEQGDNDQRGWAERITDAIVMWMRRIFSTTPKEST